MGHPCVLQLTTSETTSKVLMSMLVEMGQVCTCTCPSSIHAFTASSVLLQSLLVHGTSVCMVHGTWSWYGLHGIPTLHMCVPSQEVASLKSFVLSKTAPAAAPPASAAPSTPSTEGVPLDETTNLRLKGHSSFFLADRLACWGGNV